MCAARRARRRARSRPSCRRALGEPGVEVDAEALERRLDPLDHQLPAGEREVLGVALGGAVDLGRQLGDVVALVAVLGHRLAARARADRLAEPDQLRAGVVEVVLARRPRGRRTRAAAPARRRRRRGGRWPRSSARSGWRRRTRPGRARARRPCPPPQSSPAASTCAAAAVYQASARKTLRNPGPATSTRSTRSPSRSRSAAPSRSAISRGGAPSFGASSIAALVE